MPRLLETKIKSLNNLKKIISRLKSGNKRIVFTNGCFDLLHYGHVKYLQDARKKGDILVVGLNSDASVRRIKGHKKPVVKQKDRARVAAALESVDYVVIFSQDTPLDTIKAIKPDLLVKGADWSAKRIVGGDFVSGYGGCVTTIQFVKGYSTSKLIKEIGKKS
jgi:D-beta-D-heptose 7-phosphate kinase/D-beta-D-heptose 1-phosphate adenosyltransferase